MYEGKVILAKLDTEKAKCYQRKTTTMPDCKGQLDVLRCVGTMAAQHKTRQIDEVSGLLAYLKRQWRAHKSQSAVWRSDAVIVNTARSASKLICYINNRGSFKASRWKEKQEKVLVQRNELIETPEGKSQ